MSLTKQ